MRTQSDSLRTLGELLGVFGIVLDKSELDLQETFHELKRCVVKQSDGENRVVVRGREKADLWIELEMKSLRKFVVLVYSISCLILLTRLQLNIVARREYLDSSTRFEIEETLAKQYSIRNWFLEKWRSLRPVGDDDDDNDNLRPRMLLKGQEDNYKIKLQTIQANEQAFLSLSWWLINKGWTQFDELAEQTISREFSKVSPRDTIKFSEFNAKMRNVFNALNSLIVTNRIDNKSNDKIQLKSLLLPDDPMLPTIFKQALPTQTLTILTDHNFDDTLLRMFIDETRRCIDSDATVLILDSLIEESLKYAIPLLESKVKDKLKKKSKSKAKNKSDKQIGDSTSNPELECEMGVYVIALKDICNGFLYDSEYIARLNEVSTLEDLSISVFGNF